MVGRTLKPKLRKKERISGGSSYSSGRSGQSSGRYKPDYSKQKTALIGFIRILDDIPKKTELHNLGRITTIIQSAQNNLTITGINILFAALNKAKIGDSYTSRIEQLLASSYDYKQLINLVQNWGTSGKLANSIRLAQNVIRNSSSFLRGSPTFLFKHHPDVFINPKYSVTLHNLINDFGIPKFVSYVEINYPDPDIIKLTAYANGNRLIRCLVEFGYFKSDVEYIASNHSTFVNNIVNYLLDLMISRSNQNNSSSTSGGSSFNSTSSSANTGAKNTTYRKDPADMSESEFRKFLKNRKVQMLAAGLAATAVAFAVKKLIDYRRKKKIEKELEKDEESTTHDPKGSGLVLA